MNDRHSRTFRYRAIARDGSTSTGTLHAASPSQVRASLATRGLLAIRIEDDESGERRRSRLSAADLAIGLRILADLLDSGLPMEPALQALPALAPPSWMPVLPALSRSVREGSGFAAALRSAPVDVPAVVMGVIEAGEAGTGLTLAIRQAARWSEQSADTRAAVRAALIYPAFVAAAGAGAIAVLVTVVLPRFATILADFGQALPPSTRLLLRVADVARVGLVPTVSAACIAAIAFHRWRQLPTNRRRIDRALLATPLVGELRRANGVARFARSMAAMLRSGTSALSAMAAAARATGDLELEARMAGARELIVGGVSIARAIELRECGTPTLVRLARAGEESGRLSDMLDHAAAIEEMRVQRTMRTVLKLLEPALLLAFALLVGLVAAALLQAIYSVRPVS